MTLFKHEPTPRGAGNGENHRGVVRCAVDYAQWAIAGGDAAWEEQISKTVLREKLKLCHQRTDKLLLIRQDSGNDAAENHGIVLEDGSWFIVKRNPRRSESKEEWIDNVKAWCRDICHPREGKRSMPAPRGRILLTKTAKTS